MTCLDDRRLVDVHFGDGTPAEREHLHACAGCNARATALARDLGRVDAVLRTSRPPRRAARIVSVWRLAPLAVAAALVLAVAVYRQTGTSVVAPDDDTLALADELADTLAADVDFGDGTTARIATASTCAWGDPFLGVGCEEPAVMQIAWR